MLAVPVARALARRRFPGRGLLVTLLGAPFLLPVIVALLGLLAVFGRAGWEIPSPPATMFAWVPLPEPFKPLGSLEFSKLLLEHADVAVAPGIGFGEYGDDHVRIALVENEHRIRQAARNVKKFFANTDQIVGEALTRKAAE